ncbi:UMP kinase [Patescibacteria group bacterium]|nr:UMP kinase [Patescibacteria group bacterium]
METSPYKKVVLKLSGELMMGDLEFGVDLNYMKQFADELIDVSKSGIKLLVEVGGGNIYRWRQAPEGMKRNTADMMGMLGSVMTALNLRDVINDSYQAEALSPLSMPYVIPQYTPKKAAELLDEGKIVVVGGGTGQQFFTTDSGAALHAAQIDADIVLKGTDVDGVYSEDPHVNPSATKYDHVSYSEVLEKNLSVMDMSAFALLRDASIPIMVFDVQNHGNISKAVMGEKIGTIVSDN